MLEQAYLSVQLVKTGDTHSEVQARLVDETEITLTVNNHDLVKNESNPNRGKLLVKCSGMQVTNDVPHVVSIELPVGHITYGSRITVHSRYLERPNPTVAEHTYDTRPLSVRNKKETI